MPSALTVTFVQSTILNAFANLCAQLIDQRNSPNPFTLNTLALFQFITYGILIVPINFAWQRALEARYPGFPSRAELSRLWDWCCCCCCCYGGSRGGKRSRKRSKSISSLRDYFSSSLTSAPFSISTRDRPRDRYRAAAGGGGGSRLPSHHRREKSAQWAARSQGPSGLYSFAMKFIFDQTVGSVMNIVLFIVLINVLKGTGGWRVWELVIEDFPPIMVARLKYRPLVSSLMYTVIPVDRRVVFGSACGVIWGIYLSLYAVV